MNKKTLSYSIVLWLFAFAVIIYFGNEFYKSRNEEKFYDEHLSDDEVMESPRNSGIGHPLPNVACPAAASALPPSQPLNVQAHNPNNTNNQMVNFNSGVNNLFSQNNSKPVDNFPSDKLTAKDLLPKETDNLWSQSVPNVSNKNFLLSGANIGINQVGQVNRNPNLQIRSEPPNPQVVVSPWSQTTIGPDLARPVLEIGCGK